MEFPTLGNRCSSETCNQLDFLPITCSFCSQTYCKVHHLPFDHSCSVYEERKSNKNDAGGNSSYTCSLPNCGEKELIHILCPHCGLHFCLQHRHQVDHQCTKLEQPREVMPKTAELVRQIVAKNQDKKAVRRGVKSEKLAAKVQLMKLKQKSKGLKELPSEERVYLLVNLPLDRKEEAVFVSHFWSLGKCIDFIASACQIPNHNSVTWKPQLNLFDSSDVCISDRKDVIVKDMISKEELFNGQSVWLRYIDPSK